MDRRTLLRAVPVLASLPLLGCTAEPPPPPDPDDLLRTAAAERERALLAQYDAVLLSSPGLAERLVGVRADHAAHLAALIGPAPSGRPSASAAPPAEVPPAADVAAALTGLAAAERDAADAHREACLVATDGDLAGLLASLSASEASHPVVLA